MEELINKLDNWALFRLFGGLGVILSTIIVYLSKIINQRIVHKWQEKSNKELAELKGAINKNNSVVTTLTQQYGQNFQKLLDKRIEATDFFLGRYSEDEIFNSDIKQIPFGIKPKITLETT